MEHKCKEFEELTKADPDCGCIDDWIVRVYEADAGIEVNGEFYITIFYCPFCGKKL